MPSSTLGRRSAPGLLVLGALLVATPAAGQASATIRVSATVVASSADELGAVGESLLAGPGAGPELRVGLRSDGGESVPMARDCAGRLGRLASSDAIRCGGAGARGAVRAVSLDAEREGQADAARWTVTASVAYY